MISVVMPTYNQGRYIREAIDSVLAQTFTNFELIVVNDGSTDRTADVLAEYSDPRLLTLSRIQNEGTGYALNCGFARASGEFETWWASDNVMYPECLETLHEHLVEHPEIDHVYANNEIWQMDVKGAKVIGRKNLLAEVKDQTWSLDRFLAYYFLGCCWLWRRDLRLRVGGLFQREPCEDYDMALRMAIAGGQFAHIPNCLAWFRRHNKNMSARCRANGHRATRFVIEKAKAAVAAGIS